MPYFKTPTTTYHYDRKGSGKPLVFAHGLFVDNTIFAHQFSRLSVDYECFSFDMPGHGRSGFNPCGWSLDDITDDFAEFIIKKNIRKPILIGQSQGGMVFMRLAVKYPELAGGLVLIGTSPKAEYEERIAFWKKTIAIFERNNKLEINALLEEIQRKVVSEYFLKYFPKQAAEELKMMQSQHPAALKLATEAAVLNRKDFSGKIGNIACKTLIICGKDDHATPLDISQMMAERIENSQLEIIANASHHIPIETPEALTNCILTFLHQMPWNSF